MRIVCWHAIHIKYHPLFFFQKFRKMQQNLLSAAVVIGALRVNRMAGLFIIWRANVQNTS